MDEIVIIFVILILFVVYFLPTIIAYRRKSNNTGLIFLVNFLLGGTGIGWIIVLIWACEGRTKLEAGKKRKENESLSL